MTITQIKYFITTAKCLNFTKAASQLYITQPALSRQIAAIEAELNMQLFESDYIPNAPFVPKQPIYDAQETPFVSEGEYEIVGIY